jgi:DNA polymerase V
MSSSVIPIEQTEEPQSASKFSILYSCLVPCGFPSPAEDYIETPLDLNEKLILKPAATFFVRAKGLSMHPTIEPNDLLVVDRSREASHNSLIVATLDAEFTVKRFIKRAGKAFLVSDNEAFKEIEVSSRSDFSIWGVVIHTIRSF